VTSTISKTTFSVRRFDFGKEAEKAVVGAGMIAAVAIYVSMRLQRTDSSHSRMARLANDLDRL